MPRFEDDRIDLVAAKRLVLFGCPELQHTLGIRYRPAISCEDHVTGECVAGTALADADPTAAQILKIAYAGIGASDDSERLRKKRDQHPQLRIGTSDGERSRSMKCGVGNVSLRQAEG